jgi:hypothetical protein
MTLRKRHPLKLAIPPPTGEPSRRPLFAIMDLPARRYVDTVARVASLKAREVDGELEPNVVYSSILGNSTYRAPFGRFGRMGELVFKRAGDEAISEIDGRSFIQFRKDIYDIDVNPEETPIRRFRLMKLSTPLTYPPSCVFFDRSLLFLTAGVQRYIEVKSYPLKRRTKTVIEKALKGLKIGEFNLQYLSENSHSVDVQRLLLSEIRQKLLGRTVEAKVNVTQLRYRFYFFPQRVMTVA